MKTFSIIIPVYNGHDVIGRALDSIYSQGLVHEDFEVICVDDCSPTMETWNVLNSYTYNGIHPSNLILKRHEVNKRQGAARNTGLKYAEGEWILYLDADDYFVEGSLLELQEGLIKYQDVDLVMFDYWEDITTSSCNVINKSVYANQNLKARMLLSGGDFIQKYPVPWGPVFYAYKRNFLLMHDMRFVESVRFEDTDYTIQCTLLANKMLFLPIDVYGYVIHRGTTTTISNDKIKITEYAELAFRLKIIAENFMYKDKNAAMAAMNHHIFCYHTLLTMYLWRLSCNDIIEILTKYPPYEVCNDKLINFTCNCPRLYAALAQVVRPFLLLAQNLKNKLKR